MIIDSFVYKEKIKKRRFFKKGNGIIQVNAIFLDVK